MTVLDLIAALSRCEHDAEVSFVDEDVCRELGISVAGNLRPPAKVTMVPWASMPWTSHGGSVWAWVSKSGTDSRGTKRL